MVKLIINKNRQELQIMDTVEYYTSLIELILTNIVQILEVGNREQTT